MICFDRVIRVLLNGVQCRGDQLIEHPWVYGCTVGGDLCRDRAGAQRLGEEPPSCGQVAPHGQQDVDDLAILIDRPVEIGSLASDLHGHCCIERLRDHEAVNSPAKCALRARWTVPIGHLAADEHPSTGDFLSDDHAIA